MKSILSADTTVKSLVSSISIHPDYRCGKGPHFQQVCLAKDPVCHKCEKKGHYSLQCFTKAVTEVTAADAAPCDTLYDTSYLTAVTDGKSNTSWNITVVVDELSATLVYKERSCTHPVYVVKSQARTTLVYRQSGPSNSLLKLNQKL